jgi:hypothetical protein
MDLAPMEPVMESSTAGDLITFGTPAKARISTSGTGTYPDNLSWRVASPNNSAIGEIAEMSPITAVLRKLVPANDAEVHSGPPSYLSLPIEQDEDSDTDSEDFDMVSRPDDRLLVFYPQHPTFVTVIGLLPQALFWAAAAPVAEYSTKAYDALIEKVAGIGLSAMGAKDE